MEKPIRSGDFLSDVDITLTVKSGKTDFESLAKLVNAIVASCQSIADTKVVFTEIEDKVNKNSERTLVVLKRNLYIE